jgi:hypothetical protein
MSIFPAHEGAIVALTTDTVTIGSETICVGPHLRDYLALCKARDLPVRVLVRDGAAFNVARADEWLSDAHHITKPTLPGCTGVVTGCGGTSDG